MADKEYKGRKASTPKTEGYVSIDLDKVTPSEHNWVDRGLIMSCEGGSHPYHETHNPKGRKKQK